MTKVEELFENYETAYEELTRYLEKEVANIDKRLWEEDKFGREFPWKGVAFFDRKNPLRLNRPNVKNFYIHGKSIRFVWSDSFFEIPISFFDDKGSYVEALNLKIKEIERASAAKRLKEFEKTESELVEMGKLLDTLLELRREGKI